MDFQHLNAPATKMLATNCACCGTPLVDTESVTKGVGPVCWKKHFRKEWKALSEEVRTEANKLVWLAACHQGTIEALKVVPRLVELGCYKIAQIITLHNGYPVLEMKEEGDFLWIETRVKTWQTVGAEMRTRFQNNAKTIGGRLRKEERPGRRARWFLVVPSYNKSKLKTLMRDNLIGAFCTADMNPSQPGGARVVSIFVVAPRPEVERKVAA